MIRLAGHPAPLARVRRVERTDDRLLMLAAVGAWMLARLAPETANLLTQVAVIATVTLSLDVSVHRLPAPALVQPGALALAAWTTGALLARDQSPVVAVALGVAGATLAAALPAALPGVRDPRRLALVGLSAGVLLALAVPPLPPFGPPVLLGIGLATAQAGLTVALLALLAGARLLRAVETDELGRWLAAAAVDTRLTLRSGVDPRGVTAAALALAGAIAGLAGAALAIASLGQPPPRGLDPVLGIGWLLALLLAHLLGGGTAGLLGGAAIYIGLSEVGAALGLHPVALAGPLLAALLLRGER